MRSEPWAALLLFAVLYAFALPARAAEILNFPKPRAPESRVRDIPDRCLEWTDGCRICTRPPGGKAVCSNVGIACLLEKPRCTRQ